MGRDKEIKPNELNLKDLPEFLGYKDILHLTPDDWTLEEREKEYKRCEEESAKLTDWSPM